MRHTKLAAAGACIAAVAAAPAAQAQDTGTSTVTGVATSELSVSVPLTVTSTGLLKAGASTVFTASVVDVVDPAGTWTLSVRDTSGTTAGQLKKTADVACVAASAAATGSALTFAGDATAGTDATGTLSATNATVASGGSTNLADTVSVTYTQPTIDKTVDLAAGCPYATTITYTVS